MNINCANPEVAGLNRIEKVPKYAKNKGFFAR